MKLYQVIFECRYVPAHEPEAVQAACRQLFKLTVAQAEALFSAQRVVLKRNLTRDVALRYQVQLREIGMLCRIEAVAEDRPVVVDQEAQAPDQPWTLAAVGAPLLSSSQRPPPVAPNTDHLSIAALGVRLSEPRQVPASQVDISHLRLVEP